MCHRFTRSAIITYSCQKPTVSDPQHLLIRQPAGCAVTHQPPDTSSEAAPLVTRRPSGGFQTVHHDALNSHWTVSDVFCRHGACRRRQPHEVRSAIRRHRSVHKAALSH